MCHTNLRCSCRITSRRTSERLSKDTFKTELSSRLPLNASTSERDDGCDVQSLSSGSSGLFSRGALFGFALECLNRSSRRTIPTQRRRYPSVPPISRKIASMMSTTLTSNAALRVKDDRRARAPESASLASRQAHTSLNAHCLRDECDFLIFDRDVVASENFFVAQRRGSPLSIMSVNRLSYRQNVFVTASRRSKGAKNRGASASRAR